MFYYIIPACYQRFEDLVPDGGRAQNLFLTHSQSQLECLCLWLLGTQSSLNFYLGGSHQEIRATDSIFHHKISAKKCSLKPPLVPSVCSSGLRTCLSFIIFNSTPTSDMIPSWCVSSLLIPIFRFVMMDGVACTIIGHHLQERECWSH
jgi:hypothetical protein